MPKRYIDADAVEEMIDKCVMFGNTALIDKYEVFGRLRNIPTADVVPVKHARWVLDEDPHDGDCRCSACLVCIDQMHERNHKLLNAITGNKWWTFYKYCPNCGAEMTEENDG